MAGVAFLPSAETVSCLVSKPSIIVVLTKQQKLLGSSGLSFGSNFLRETLIFVVMAS